MSLGAPRQEKDKSGQPCLVADVAVNSVWYSDTMVSEFFNPSWPTTLSALPEKQQGDQNA
jgi:hypothetical protein